MEYSAVLSSRSEGKLVKLGWTFHSQSTRSGVPLFQVANLELKSSTLTIDPFNKVRPVPFKAFVDQNYLVDNVINEVISKMGQFEIPEGYSFKMGGEYETRQESFAGFNSVIIVTVFLFIAVLILLFKALKSTILVLSIFSLEWKELWKHFGL